MSAQPNRPAEVSNINSEMPPAEQAIKILRQLGESECRTVAETSDYGLKTIREQLRNLTDRGTVIRRPDPTYPNRYLFRLKGQPRLDGYVRLAEQEDGR